MEIIAKGLLGVYLVLLLIASLLILRVDLKGQKRGIVFALYLYVTLFVEFGALILKFNGETPFLLYNIYLFLSYLTLISLYLILIEFNTVKYLYLFAVIFIAIIGVSINPLFQKGQYFLVKTSSIFLISYCLGSLFILIGYFIRPKLIPIQKEFSFWFAISQLFWSVMFLFRVGAISYINSVAPSVQENLYTLLLAANILTYLSFIKAITCLPFQKKSFLPILSP